MIFNISRNVLSSSMYSLLMVALCLLQSYLLGVLPGLGFCEEDEDEATGSAPVSCSWLDWYAAGE